MAYFQIGNESIDDAKDEKNPGEVKIFESIFNPVVVWWRGCRGVNIFVIGVI